MKACKEIEQVGTVTVMSERVFGSGIGVEQPKDYKIIDLLNSKTCRQCDEGQDHLVEWKWHWLKEGRQKVCPNKKIKFPAGYDLQQK